jgi:hypothetical protein
MNEPTPHAAPLSHDLSSTPLTAQQQPLRCTTRRVDCSPRPKKKAARSDDVDPGGRLPAPAKPEGKGGGQDEVVLNAALIMPPTLGTAPTEVDGASPNKLANVL